MAHLVSKAQLYNSRSRVAAADDGGSISFSQCLSNSYSTCCQCRVLKNAHRTVPNNSLCRLNSVSEQSLSLGADVQTFLVSRDLVSINDLNAYLSVDRIREAVNNSGVDRQEQLLAVLLSLLDHLLAVVQLGVIYQ